MSIVKVERISHEVVRIRVVRKMFKYYWPYWKRDKLDKYDYYKRYMGEKSLKVIEANENGEFKLVGFTVPGAGRHPTEINLTKIEFSNGKVLLLADRKISFVHLNTTDFLHRMHNSPEWGTWQDLNVNTRHRWCYFRGALPNGVVLDYNQAKHLRVGQVVKEVRPLRLDLDNQCVTDGDYKFPLVRPFGHDGWRRHFPIRSAKGITADNWMLLLKSIIGLPIHEVIDTSRIHDQVRNRMRTIKTKERDNERKRRVGQCFAGHVASSVAIGSNLIFILQKDNVLTYVVDSPEYANAIYVFDDYNDAHDWASRNIGWREARKRAKLFKVHSGNWREEVDAVLVS